MEKRYEILYFCKNIFKMSYRHTLEAALESLHEIEDLVKGFPSDGNIPIIELDLTLQRIRNLYELMLMMKRNDETAEEKAAVAAVAAKKTAVAAAVASGAVAEEEKIKTVNKPLEKKVTVEGIAATTAPAAAPSAATAAPPPKTLADQFTGKATLHETFHQTLAQDGETLAHAKPVSNLLTAIAINDRFTFIRELFNNDTGAFENTITILNDASSFNDAYNHMIQHFEWDMDSEPVKLLLDIIRRKFIKGRYE
jgi:hypothetical protein